MILTAIIWLLVWGGMYTGLYNLERPELFTSPLHIFQGMRAILPILALYICLMWMFVLKMKFPPFLSPLGLFFYYCLTGIAVSFLSEEVLRSLYWGLIFLAAVLVLWIFMSRIDSLMNLRIVIYINYIAAVVIFLGLIYELMKRGQFGEMGLQLYELPFGLGEMRANGVGRFALIVIIICVIRLIYHTEIIRYALFFLLLPALYLLIQTQSRTSLLGLGVASVLFVLIRGFKWQFLFVGPVAAYVVWLAGYEQRSHKRFEMLISLTGRESTWQEAFELIKQSPFFGWGFHSDRIMLESQHIHNSYIHAMLHSGIIGIILFVAAIFSIWYVIFRRNVLRRMRNVQGIDQPMLIESILLIGYMVSRSLFESTAAFYGVDLLILLPAVIYIFQWTEKNPIQQVDEGEQRVDLVRETDKMKDNFLGQH